MLFTAALGTMVDSNNRRTAKIAGFVRILNAAPKDLRGVFCHNNSYSVF